MNIRIWFRLGQLGDYPEKENELMNTHRSTIGEFIVRFGWLIGLLSLATAGILYSISIQSLAFGLGSVDLMANATDTSQLFAWSINLLEIIGLCWILAEEMQLKGDAKEDRYLNAVISIAMIVILAGDFSAILYASGGLTNLPGDWFGKILGGVLRVIKSIIGAAGSETLILIGLYLIIEWFQQYALVPETTEDENNEQNAPLRRSVPAFQQRSTPTAQGKPVLDDDQSGVQPGRVRIMYPNGQKRIVTRHFKPVVSNA